MKGSQFVFDYVCLLFYKCHKKSELWRIIYRFSWLDKKQKSNNNSINKRDNKCFPFAITVALNHDEIKKDLQLITKIKPLSKYNQEGLNLPWEKGD